MILRTRKFISPFTLKFSVLNVQLNWACSMEGLLGIDNELELHLFHGEPQALASLKMTPTVVSLFPFYIRLDLKLVERRNRVLFQVASTVLCLVKNDYFLTMTGSKEKFAIRLTIQKLPNGSKGI